MCIVNYHDDKPTFFDYNIQDMNKKRFYVRKLAICSVDLWNDFNAS